MKRLFYLIYIFFAAIAVPAQNFPGNPPVFPGSEVSRVDIYLHPDSLAAIYANLENEYEYHATFIYTNSLLGPDTLNNIGFRLRGGTSLISQKKSFNISFNTYVPGRKYHGLEKMNLNGEHNDPCILRSKITWDLFAAYGVPAPRAAHCKVYINGYYYGLYINVEQIDEEFAKARFGNKKGNLYKCLWPADLQYLGSNPDLYKLMAGDRRVYELKTNETLDDYSDLAHFIHVINHAPADSFAIMANQVINVQSFLKYLAIECITGHWDGYSYNKNNYYLYHNTQTGKFEFIPYDVDNTFGIDWMNIDWGKRDVNNWSAAEPRPLAQRMLLNQLYRDEYNFYLKQFLEELFSPSHLFPGIDSAQTLIFPEAAADPYRPLDYGWTMQNFAAAFTVPLGGHVKYGLKQFITTRNYYGLQQVQTLTQPALRINEFMAGNTSGLQDEYGEYDDWIEIYNAGSLSVWLGDKYLTDNLNLPAKWKLPDENLAPGGFLLVWADDSTEQGPRHSNFRLDVSGEQIGIFTSPANGSKPIDILTYGSQSTDISSGLLPNGKGLMKTMASPTPGESNGGNIGFEETEEEMELLIYPNPVNDQICVKIPAGLAGAEVEIQLTDLSGRSMTPVHQASGTETLKINTDGLKSGIYFLKIMIGNGSNRQVRVYVEKVIKY